MIEGHVYFASASNGNIKIGFSTNPIKRVFELRGSGQAHGHEDIKLITTIRGSRTDEKGLHAVFEDYAVANEWFSPLPIKAFLAEVSTSDAMKAYIAGHKPSARKAINLRLTQLEIRRLSRITDRSKNPLAPSISRIMRYGLELAMAELEAK